MLPQKIISVSDLSYILEDFANSQQSRLTLGEIAGCGLFKYVSDSVIGTHQYPFEQVLFINGCQDLSIYQNKIPNVMFWADLFRDSFVGTTEPQPFLTINKYEYELNTTILSKYKMIVVMEAHLIPEKALSVIDMNYGGSIILLVDPYDINGERFAMVPTIVDSFYKLPLTIAYARQIFGAQSMVNKKMKNTITKAPRKLSRRSIGKIDSNQYISNNQELIDEIRKKQYDVKFRKNQKVICYSDNLNQSYANDGSVVTFTKYAMGTILSANNLTNQIRLRLYNDKREYQNNFSYEEPTNKVFIKPANILSVREASYHRYKNAVIIVNDNTTEKEIYSILKNSSNVVLSRE